MQGGDGSGLNTMNSRRKRRLYQAAVPLYPAFMLACRLDLRARAEFADRMQARPVGGMPFAANLTETSPGIDALDGRAS
jgi:hypothetical protein